MLDGLCEGMFLGATFCVAAATSVVNNALYKTLLATKDSAIRMQLCAILLNINLSYFGELCLELQFETVSLLGVYEFYFILQNRKGGKQEKSVEALIVACWNSPLIFA